MATQNSVDTNIGERPLANNSTAIRLDYQQNSRNHRGSTGSTQMFLSSNDETSINMQTSVGPGNANRLAGNRGSINHYNSEVRESGSIAYIERRRPTVKKAPVGYSGLNQAQYVNSSLDEGSESIVNQSRLSFPDPYEMNTPVEEEKSESRLDPNMSVQSFRHQEEKLITIENQEEDEDIPELKGQSVMEEF